MTTINGHPLPARLDLLLTGGAWPLKSLAPAVMARATWNASPLDAGTMSGCNAEGMLNTLAMLRSIELNELRELYGIDSSQAIGHAIALPRLDVDHAIPLMVSVCEYMVWLDYRDSPVPRVVATDGNVPEWGVIWPTFDAFADALELSGLRPAGRSLRALPFSASKTCVRRGSTPSPAAAQYGRIRHPRMASEHMICMSVP